MEEQHIHFRRYEVISQLAPEVQSTRSTLSDWLNKSWTSLVHHLTRSHEPRICQKFDRTGQPYWQCYDPSTQQLIYCFSEDEIFDWLEQLPYR
jgi:hypothetical protein